MIKGKSKRILESSIDSALLAVEIYNKPRTHFRSQAYITLMIIAWTKLFHAHFYRIIGDKFYYKKKNGRYEIVDGERKAWDLKTCIKKYNKLTEPVKSNLHFFIYLRNKIEHRLAEDKMIDTKIFGECQSLLYNYENELIKSFGSEFAISENLVYSLQFSALRSEEQKLSGKRIFSREVRELHNFIDTYRTNIDNKIFNTQEYSIKLIQIPKIANASKHDLAIEFINWKDLSKDEKAAVKKINAIVKEKTVTRSVVYHDCYKPSQVVQEVKKRTKSDFHMGDHRCLYRLFKIRPVHNDNDDPFNTKDKFCLYDELHKDYIYTKEWIELIVKLIKDHKWDHWRWRGKWKRGDIQNPSVYE